MKKVLIVLVIVIFAGLFAGTLYYLFQKSQKEPVVFQTESPFVDNIVLKTVATGNVEPRKSIALKPQVSGIIMALYVEPGDMVKEGDIIARIKIIPDMVSLNNAENRVTRARLSLTDAETQYKRQEQLYKERVISKSEFEKAEYTFKSAKEEVRAAENNLQLIKEGATKESEGTSNTLVRSTGQGMVLEVPVEVGFSVIEANNFNEGTTIAEVANMQDMIFKGKVDESEVGKISVGMPLILKVGAIDGITFEAKLVYISPKGVKESGAIQFEIKADVVLKDSVFVRAGYSANADIVLKRVDSVLTINERLVQFDENQKPFIEVETAPQVFEKREIETGLSDGIKVEVLKGVQKEDKIKIWNIVGGMR